jgi:hypothetical protein
MAPILSHGQTTSGQCGFNQVASHPADPIKRHRARRERSHPKAMLNTQTSAVALDLLENSIDPKRTTEDRKLMVKEPRTNGGPSSLSCWKGRSTAEPFHYRSLGFGRPRSI